MAKCGHYDKWREDFKLVEELGIRFLRYGPSYYRTHIGLMRMQRAAAQLCKVGERFVTIATPEAMSSKTMTIVIVK